MKVGLEKEIIGQLGNIFTATPGIEEVMIFGSRAKGTFSEGSDIDLAVKGKSITLGTILDLRSRIDMLELLYTFDIHDYYHITNKDLLAHINRVGKVLWRRR